MIRSIATAVKKPFQKLRRLFGYKDVAVREFVSCDTTAKGVTIEEQSFGMYMNKRMRKRMKRETESEIGTFLDRTIPQTLQIARKMQEELKGASQKLPSKEQLYSLTDQLLKPFIPGIPRDMHVLNSICQTCDELDDWRFRFPYLTNTKYLEYLKTLEMLLEELKQADGMQKAWSIINEFKDSPDAYTLLQSAFQKLLGYYKFLGKDFSTLRKKHIDQYLEIYSELSGQYEKYVALIVALVKASRGNTCKYSDAKKKGLYRNMSFLKEHGWEVLTSSFNRRVRNAVVSQFS